MRRSPMLLLPLFLLLVVFAPALAIDEVTDISGKIAIVGTDYNIYSYETTTETLATLSTDASDTRHYQFPTWSTDGRLAYFCCEPNANSLPIGQAFVSEDAVSAGELLYENDNEVIIYAYWSPANCGENCRELAMLMNNVFNGNLAVDILTDGDNPSSETIGTGGPFYYHWNATGTKMIFHRGNRDLDIYSRGENEITENLDRSAGTFQAPVWSPIDDRVLVGLPGSRNGQTDIAIIEDGSPTILAEDLEGLVSFQWSPDGQYVAYRTVDRLGYGALTILSADSGVIVSENIGADVVAFFWSPDSQKLAYISLSGRTSQSASSASRVSQQFVQDDTPSLAWFVYDLATESNEAFGNFMPTSEQIYLLSYFEQFAPSHRVWSPDSRYLVYAGFSANPSERRRPFVYILDTTAPDGNLNAVAEGLFGVWSFE